MRSIGSFRIFLGLVAMLGTLLFLSSGAVHAMDARSGYKADARQICLQNCRASCAQKHSDVPANLKKCRASCSNECAQNAEPPEARMEDQPCFSYCSTTKCGGATKEVRDACVLGCLASTSCTPH
jgi:hypothetical protein